MTYPPNAPVNSSLIVIIER
uniref:Uncharacterized protein n=1 Tax=Arundo donax TaxID=35708 RepID=A0A0A8YIE9_ARUDO